MLMAARHVESSRPRWPRSFYLLNFYTPTFPSRNTLSSRKRAEGHIGKSAPGREGNGLVMDKQSI